jgi:hypothetical protein
MRSTAATLALLVLPLAVSGAPAPPPPLPPQVEAVMEIRSYGERPRDLLALLLPFLGQRQFAPDSRRYLALAPRAEGSEVFYGPGEDFVVTAGRFNCIVVSYYSTRAVAAARRASPKERADRFRAALWDFLDGLPTPRPELREITWGSKYCTEARS